MTKEKYLNSLEEDVYESEDYYNDDEDEGNFSCVCRMSI